MSNYTLSQIRTDVITAVSPEDDSDLPDAFYNQRINDGIQDIVYQTVLPEFEETNETIQLVEDQRSYSLSSFSPLYLISVKNKTSDRLLDAFTTRHADTYDETRSGEPTNWFRYGDDIEVYPLPSSDYEDDYLRIRYVATPTTLSLDADTSPLAAYFDRAIREYAIAAALSDLNEPELALMHFRIYQSILKTRKSIRGRELRFQNRRLNHWR